MVHLSLKYPPASRALLGALLDELQNHLLTTPLYQTLISITKYKLLGTHNALSTTNRWNIIS